MKTLKLTWMLILGLAVVACNDDDEMKSTNKISSEEQAEIVAAAMGRSGFTGAGEQSAEHADNATGSSSRVAACGYNNESSGSFSGNIGSSIFFSLSYAYDVELECESETPKKLVSEFTYEGSFDGPRFESDYAGSGSLAVTQLNEENDNYQIDGTYKRDGSFESKIKDHASGSSNIDVDINNVQINKSTKAIESGSADASIRGSISGKGDYSFDARIVFNDNGTANITVSGDTYVMNLATGEVTIKTQS